MATLYIDTSRSTCGECGQNADPGETAHVMEVMVGDGCGSTFDAVSSHYPDFSGLYDRIREMRPDLPFVDFGATS